MDLTGGQSLTYTKLPLYNRAFTFTLFSIYEQQINI